MSVELSKVEIIDGIKSLNPIDSQFGNVANLGKSILMEAIIECGWESLPVEVLSSTLSKLKSYHKID